MAALLHVAALHPPRPAPNPHHPWTHSRATTPILSPHDAAPSKRRRAPARRLHAASNGSGVGTPPAADSRSGKKPSRKEKQRQQQRVREREEQQQLLLLKESFVEAAREEEQEDGGGRGDDELPQVVFDRILRRILFTVGVPMASGVALLNVYDALKRGGGAEVPSWVQLLTILLSFGTSALGIAYGTLSASWDPEKEGSLLGVDEAWTNWPELWKEEIEKDKK